MGHTHNPVTTRLQGTLKDCNTKTKAHSGTMYMYVTDYNDWHPMNKDTDKIGRPPTISLDGLVGRAPA